MTSTSAKVLVPISLKRINPTVIASGIFQLEGVGQVSSVSGSIHCSTNSIMLDITGSGGWTSGQSALLLANNDVNAYIEVKAEL
jgi:hypothetical protein